MARIILFNKPFQVLSQFTDDAGPADTGGLPVSTRLPRRRPTGLRLGGLAVADRRWALQQQIANPRHKRGRPIWCRWKASIDERPGAPAHGRGAEGWAHPAGQGQADSHPCTMAARPPVRERKSVPDSWLELSIREGRNRQVRRMTAAVGFPTLRLVRIQVGDWSLEELLPGEHRTIACPHAAPGARAENPGEEN